MFFQSITNYQDSVCESQQQSDSFFKHNPDMGTLAKRLIEAREKKGWSQADLANAAKIAQSFIGALEAKNQKNCKYLPEIAHALGVEAYWLKTGTKTLVAGDQKINDVVELMKGMDKVGKGIMLDKARDVVKEYPASSKKAA